MDAISEPQRDNPLVSENIWKLIFKFSIPMIISLLVSSLYNIVDQIFIGQSVGYVGNTATAVCFPLVNICTATAVLFGIGGAANFSLNMGRGKPEEAARCAGNALSCLVLAGIVLSSAVLIFLEPLILLLGATDNAISYALTYAGITAWGIPFLIFSIGAGALIRADRSPRYFMSAILSGAILNCFLDPLFIFVFNMGIAGAAYATVIGQVVSATIVFLYFRHFKSVKLTKSHIRPSLPYALTVASLGIAPFLNQTALTVVNTVMNNTLRHYGALSVYGSDIPIACVGILTKINVVVMAFIIGIGQGCQPINGFNYGAGNYARVRRTYLSAACMVTGITTTFFLCFQLFPRQIIGIFGSGSEEYFMFATRYLRIYMVMTFANGLQPLTSNFFTSIGKAQKGAWIALTRQVLFLLPLIAVLPRFLGIDGVLYAGPIADASAAALAIFLVARELKNMTRLVPVPA